MLVDSHCHLDCLDLSEFNGQLDLAIQAAQNQGVGALLCVCIDIENFPAVLAIAEQYPHIHASVGCHPNTTDAHEPTLAELVRFAEHPKVVAIGETGLDYFRSESQSGWQLERFRTHLRAARETRLPVIIHTRDAEADTIQLMQEEQASEFGGVMHCFTGTQALADAAIDMGFYISFSGIVTFKNADSLRQIAKQIPLERLLIETDSPYLAPVPFRGKSNQPAYVRQVAEFIAELRDIPLQELAQQTTQNYQTLFNIKAPA